MHSVKIGKIYGINGPVVYLKGKTDFKMSEMVYVGNEKLVGEVISLDKEMTTIQVYEETGGLKPGEMVEGSDAAVSVTLAPGILNNIFDGIERPLERIADTGGAFITRGVSVDSLDMDRLWETHITVAPGEMVHGGTVIAEVPETSAIVHKCMVPPNVEGTVVETVADGSEVRPLDISITKTTAGLLLNSVLTVILILSAAGWYRHRKATDAAPGGYTGMVETVVAYLVDDIIRPCVGPGWRRFAPFLLTVFFFILVNNLMGLIPFFPGGVNVTGNIAITLVLALAALIVINISGSRHYWKDIFWPDVPTWLKVPIPIIPLIEFVGIFTRPFALMIRLFANMMAGHAVILCLVCVIFVTAGMGAAVNSSMTAVSVVFNIFMNCLELLVAFLQAYVFTMLTAVFIGMSQEGKEYAWTMKSGKTED